MANVSYDKSIGTENRSVVAGTKLWAIVLAVVLLIGIAMILVFFTSTSRKEIGGPATDNTVSRPAEP